MLTHHVIHGPQEIFVAASADHWRALLRTYLAEGTALYARAPFAPRDRISDATVLPRIEHGRWCALCPACAQTMAVSPEWRLALCFACGAEYASLELPSDWRGIESALLAREVVNRNWLPGESVADLATENETYGVPASMTGTERKE
jgi:hypothetical protein